MLAWVVDRGNKDFGVYCLRILEWRSVFFFWDKDYTCMQSKCLCSGLVVLMGHDAAVSDPPSHSHCHMMLLVGKRLTTSTRLCLRCKRNDWGEAKRHASVVSLLHTPLPTVLSIISACVYVHTYCSPHVFHQNTVICRRRGSTNNCVVVIDVSQSSNPSICQLQGWCDISSRRDVPMRTWRDDRSTNVHALIRALKLFGVWEFPIQMPEMR